MGEVLLFSGSSSLPVGLDAEGSGGVMNAEGRCCTRRRAMVNGLARRNSQQKSDSSGCRDQAPPPIAIQVEILHDSACDAFWFLDISVESVTRDVEFAGDEVEHRQQVLDGSVAPSFAFGR